MHRHIFTGTRVQLKNLDPIEHSKILEKWHTDSEFLRFLDSSPAFPWSSTQLGEDLKARDIQNSYRFIIQVIDNYRDIGFIELDGIDWIARKAWLGMGIGERDCWGKGYAADAMDILVHFAFNELNLNRISLNVFEYNHRALHLYEHFGFKYEGRQRQWLKREGQRWDLIYMGFLRSDWEASQKSLAK